MTTQQLYNDAILAEAKARHGHGRLAEPDVTATCDNPLCGDRVTVDLRLAGDRIAELAQTTRGCILTQAAASVIGRHLPSATAEEFHRAAAEVRRLLAGDDFPADLAGDCHVRAGAGSREPPRMRAVALRCRRRGALEKRAALNRSIRCRLRWRRAVVPGGTRRRRAASGRRRRSVQWSGTARGHSCSGGRCRPAARDTGRPD